MQKMYSVLFRTSVFTLLLFLQVRFHPASSEVLASGSLDNEVRLWDANTAECVGSRDFCEHSTLYD